MGWAAGEAAEHTSHPPLAARLVGESFDLAIKALVILSRGPGHDLKFGHSLSIILGDVPQLERLLRKLWGGNPLRQGKLWLYPAQAAEDRPWGRCGPASGRRQS